ncbi:transmembrane protein, putative (macronuclear) [Tetrahymena thermophila SB210]|uniref:Transmembrane protein, putative n=1 Tax=Tetrahymena thermophila (strain SB210) TaxID=312017 RepID=W7XD25_TETTS|nr:transmembrane protein, putative [Tetrahymena thermophila SB210]EWS74508.1 transmembrane protein, putative [Tetrahymena thermophila SB210]|eukprot:XP_012652938.1 transmembrane protein, putative [Tetrahymena thermophila SB210]
MKSFFSRKKHNHSIKQQALIFKFNNYPLQQLRKIFQSIQIIYAILNFIKFLNLWIKILFNKQKLLKFKLVWLILAQKMNSQKYIFKIILQILNLISQNIKIRYLRQIYHFQFIVLTQLDIQRKWRTKNSQVKLESKENQVQYLNSNQKQRYLLKNNLVIYSYTRIIISRVGNIYLIQQQILLLKLLIKIFNIYLIKKKRFLKRF